MDETASLISFVAFWGTLAAYVVFVRVAPAIIERRRVRRELAPATDLDSDPAEGTFVCAVGVVRALDRTTVAGLSKRPCVVACSRAWAPPSAIGKFGAPYESMAFVPFLLERPGASPIIVDGDYVRLDLPRLRGAKFMRAAREALLDEHRISVRHRSMPSFEETILEVGTRVRVAGLLMKDLDQHDIGERGFRDDIPATLRLTGRLAQPVLISNHAD
jgi:hypothetical protein